VIGAQGVDGNKDYIAIFTGSIRPILVNNNSPHDNYRDKKNPENPVFEKKREKRHVVSISY